MTLTDQPFAEAIVHLKEVFHDLLAKRGSSSCDCTSELDTLHFGTFLTDIKELKDIGLLPSEIAARRREIWEQKERWRQRAAGLIEGPGALVAVEEGDAGAYFFLDAEGQVRYVVKPIDEDICCLNNRKGYGTPFNDIDHRVREDIPLYRSAQTDALCWEVAVLAGVADATPKAAMQILEWEGFYDLSTWADTGEADREKLCSVQEYIPHALNLIDLLDGLYKEGLSDDEIAARIDQNNFEDACLFVWLVFDTDAHGGNFLMVEDGIYGIKKIDNSLSFPEKNTEYIDILTWMPNAMWPVSQRLKDKIAALPVQKILEKMDEYDMGACKEAFLERVEILQGLAQREGILLVEIDVRFLILSRKGRDWALHPFSTQELVRLLKTATDE